MKYSNIDILRAISILFIIGGHCCLQLGIGPLGRFCGYTFVQVFFLMSAFLLGLKYGKEPCKMNFIFKRWKKLSAVYYPYLAAIFCVLVIIGEPLTAKDVITHLTYTNYIVHDTICGVPFGHLWYISMQMICYVMIAVLLNASVYRYTQHIATTAIGIISICCLTIVAAVICTRFHIPSRIPIVLSSYLLVFLNAREILEVFRKWDGLKNSKVIIWSIFIITNVFCLYLFYSWNLDLKLLPRDLLVLCTACSWLTLFMTTFKDAKSNNVVNFISGISFELYLVHHPFIFGYMSWLRKDALTGNLWLNILLAAIVITALSWLLNGIGKKVSKQLC